CRWPSTPPCRCLAAKPRSRAWRCCRCCCRCWRWSLRNGWCGGAGGACMLFDIDIQLPLGERTIAVAFASEAPVTALVGPSGAGKTTILHMIAGIVRPARGRIAVGGHLLYDRARGIDLPPERRRCGYVF